MRQNLLFYLLLTACFLPVITASATNQPAETRIDSIVPPPVEFTPAAASRYILRLVEKEDLWKPAGENIKQSLSRLVDHFYEPYDSVRSRLERFNYDEVQGTRTYLTRSDTLPLKWLNPTTFIIDTVPLEKEPFFTRKTVMMYNIDAEMLANQQELPPKVEEIVQMMLQRRDTITETIIDTRYLDAKGVRMFHVSQENINPPVLPAGSAKTFQFLSDSSGIVISETRRIVLANRESPFYILPGERMTDSLRYAVSALVAHTQVRDSILLNLRDIDGRRTHMWLSERESDFYRFWVKNEANDSITLWVGNPSRNELTLILEDNVTVERREKRRADDIPITTATPLRTIARLKPLEEIPVYWKTGLESAFMLNQTYFSNWARGGDNSLSTMLDIRTLARYNNTANKTHWTNTGRLRYGSIVTEANGFRTNMDMLEFNSQYNKVMKGKVDFSSTLYFKTQIAKGYNYTKDPPLVVSKFLNPGTFTVGVGIEYKPYPRTRLNFSPLSYRNTFVLDTATINQRLHGVDIDKRSRQEMGGQLVINSTNKIMETLSMTNAIRLFSGYLDKPQNVDVDWEISFDKQINWFFLIRLNLHLIYDDDIRIAVLDNEGKPVLRPDGTQKRVAKPQFKQFMGLTMSFKL
jgi:hypothetical protein